MYLLLWKCLCAACIGRSVNGPGVVCLKLRATRCLLSCSRLHRSKLMAISLKDSKQKLLRSGPEFTPHYAPTVRKHLCILMDSSFIRSDLISHWPVSLLYPVLFKSSGKSVARILHSCKFSNIGYFLFYTSLLGIHVLHFPDWDFCKYPPKIPQQLFKSTCFHLFGQTELLLERGKLDACHNVQFVAESSRSGLGCSEVLGRSAQIIIHI